MKFGFTVHHVMTIICYISDLDELAVYRARLVPFRSLACGCTRRRVNSAGVNDVKRGPGACMYRRVRPRHWQAIRQRRLPCLATTAIERSQLGEPRQTALAGGLLSAPAWPLRTFAFSFRSSYRFRGKPRWCSAIYDTRSEREPATPEDAEDVPLFRLLLLLFFTRQTTRSSNRCLVSQNS